MARATLPESARYWDDLAAEDALSIAFERETTRLVDMPEANRQRH
jgi:hypothetical protein